MRNAGCRPGMRIQRSANTHNNNDDEEADSSSSSSSNNNKHSAPYWPTDSYAGTSTASRHARRHRR